MKYVLSSLCALAFVSAVFGGGRALPATPAGIEELVYARSFTLAESYTFAWRKERPEVTSGLLLVLKVDPALVVPRQVAEPVLYVGDQSAQRVNFGNESGHVIAIVPGDVDLSRSPIWFGSPELPERVDVSTIKAERAKAASAGIVPLSSDKIASAFKRGGSSLALADKCELLRSEVSDLIVQYSPQEKHLAEAFNVSVSKPAPKSKAD